MATLALDGLRVEYDCTGSGPDLLCLHSLLTELSVFDRVLPSLAATRRVTRFNLPGFGGSTPTALESVADHADHVARVMQALELPASTAVFGNGFGAFVAAELAIRHGRRFGPLVLADAVAAFPEAACVPFRGMAEKVRAGGTCRLCSTPRSGGCSPRVRRTERGCHRGQGSSCGGRPSASRAPARASRRGST
jgi:3-oxoadipate enol-lactonase